MLSQLVNSNDDLERQNAKLLKITEVLMNRVEQVTNDGGAAYEQFQRAVMLEDQVRSRTRELEEALNLLNESNSQLSDAMREAETSRKTLSDAIETVREGFGLFDGEDRLVLCNSRFGMFMPDIQDKLKPGLRFRDYIELASQSRFMAFSGDLTPAQWVDQRRLRHTEDHVVFNVAITGDRWVQISEHRTEGRQTVILQTDVTDIMRIERRERSRILDNQSRVIEATLEHIEQGIAVFDKSAVLSGWNQRLGDLLNVPLTAVRIGVNARSYVDHLRHVAEPGDVADRLAAWIDGEGARPALDLEFNRRPNLVLRMNARAMPDGGFVMSFTDMTAERSAALELQRAKDLLERRVLERTLELEDALAVAERANASKSRFVAAASHDLLQPLSAAKLFASSLIADGPGVQTDNRVPAKIGHALESVEEMIGALLEISKLETVKENFEISQFSLGDLLSRLEGEFEPAARKKGISLKVLPTEAWVETDAAYLRRIIQNLIGNAVRYTQRGRILVGTRRRGPMVRVDIYDTGPGIPEDKQSEIFDEFKRLGDARSAGEGLGLGLTIVDKACGALGHPLMLRSEVGKGSCFSVSLPRVAAQSSGAVSPGGGPRANSGGVGRLVVVIDDDEEVREALEYALAKCGHHVLAYNSVQNACAVLAETELEPDHIILDYQLRVNSTALDALPELRKIYPSTDITILTANRSQEVKSACEREGLTVEQKPASVHALDRRIRGALSDRGRPPLVLGIEGSQ